MHHTINASDFFIEALNHGCCDYRRKSIRERQTCIGLIFGGLFKQLKEALIVMSVDYSLL
jgi:hypothetical protein